LISEKLHNNSRSRRGLLRRSRRDSTETPSDFWKHRG